MPHGLRKYTQRWPSLALRLAVGLAQHAHARAPQVRDGRVEVVDVEGQVVAADVAVAGLVALAVGRLPLEDLEVRAVLAAVEAQLAHDRARVHVEVLGHPVVVALERAERVHVLAPDHVDEEAVRLVEVGNGEADVLRSAQPRKCHGAAPFVAMTGCNPMTTHEALRHRLHLISLKLDAIDAYAGRHPPRPTRADRGGIAMPEQRRLDPAAPWVEISTTAADWKAADPQLLADDARPAAPHPRLRGDACSTSPARASCTARRTRRIGQEGGAVGSIVGLRSTDGDQRFAPRPPPVPRQGAHARLGRQRSISTTSSPPTSQVVLQRTLAEILGLAQGYCRGRGGSMHLQWFEAGALGTNAIVGGGVPLAAGNAWAQKHSGTSDLTVTYFGDGATNIGSVLESMNLAAAWKLPVAFFIENNLYAVSTTHRGGHRRAAAVGPRPGLRHPVVAGRRHGSARRASRHGRGGAAPADRRRARRSSRPRSTATSTRTARTRAARSATAPRRRRPPGASAIRSPASPARWPGSASSTDAQVDAVRAQAARGRCDAATAELLEADPEHDGHAPHPARALARPGVRRRRRPRRRERARRRAGARARSPTPRARDDVKFVDAVAGVMDRRMERGRAHRRARRGRAPTEGRHERRNQGPRRTATPVACSARRSARTRSPASAAAWRSTAGSGRWSSSCTPTSCGSPPTRSSTRSARRATCSAATTRCRSCCAPRSRWARATARSTSWTRPASSRPSPGWRIVAPSTAADYVGLMNAALALDDPVLVIEHVDLYGEPDDGHRRATSTT